MKQKCSLFKKSFNEFLYKVLFNVLNIYIYLFSPDSKHEVSGSERDVIYLLNILVLVPLV